MSTPANDTTQAVQKFRGWMTLVILTVAGVVFLGVITYKLAAYKSESGSPPQQATGSVAPVAAKEEEKCSSSHPCELFQREDGSTEPVVLGDGKRVCFESSFWVNLPKLGFTTSLQGGRETRYACTHGEVAAGKCTMTFFDRFRFIPEKGVPLPKYYWLTKRGGTVC